MMARKPPEDRLGLVNSTFEAEHLRRSEVEKSFEVHPNLVWGLPRKDFRSQILGVAPEVLDDLHQVYQVDRYQVEVEARTGNSAWMGKVAGSLNERLRKTFRPGGGWCWAFCPSGSVNGADAQRLITFSMTSAATLSLERYWDHLNEKQDLALGVPSLYWIELIVGGKTGANREAAWNRLATFRLRLWMFGFAVETEDPSGVGSIGFDVFRDIGAFPNAATEPNGKQGVPIPIPLSLTPLGIAFASGFRKRILTAARHEGGGPEIPTSFHKWVWKLSEPARRMSVHLVSIPCNHGSPNFEIAYKHLGDLARIAAIFGSRIKISKGGFARDIREQCARVLQEISDTAPKEFRPFLASVTRFFPPGVVALVARGIGQTATSCAKFPPAATEKGHIVGSEVSPLTYRSVPPDPRIGHMEPMDSPQATSGLITPQGQQIISNKQVIITPKKDNKKIFQEERKEKEPIATFLRIEHGAITADFPTPPCDDWVLAHQPNSNRAGGSVWTIPSPRIDDPSKMAIGEELGEMEDSPEARALRWMGIEQLPTRAHLRNVTTFREYAQATGVGQRKDVWPDLPGATKVVPERYGLPFGSTIQDSLGPETWEVEAAFSPVLHERPDMGQRFPCELIRRLAFFRPMTIGRPLTLPRIFEALQAAPNHMTKFHVENLMRLIDLAPDDILDPGESKVEAIFHALRNRAFANPWLLWAANAKALEDWPSFHFIGPYRAFAGAKWRRFKSNPLHLEEQRARIFAEWWHLTRVRPLIGPGTARSFPTPDDDSLVASFEAFANSDEFEGKAGPPAAVKSEYQIES